MDKIARQLLPRFAPHNQKGRPLPNRAGAQGTEDGMQVNGASRQKDKTSSMYFKIEEIIAYITQFMSLEEGDLILTGTPLGAGPLRLGDNVECFARVGEETLTELKFTIVK